MKTLRPSELAAAISLFSLICGGCTKHADSPPAQRITSRDEGSRLSWLNVHASKIHVLTVDGKDYPHARGIRTFYLQVPNTNLIVFITDDSNGTVTYHIYDLETRNETTVSAPSSLFGNAIGASSQARTDTVVLTSNMLSLCTVFARRDGSVKDCDELDIASRSLVSQKTYVCDQAGKVIEQHDRN